MGARSGLFSPFAFWVLAPCIVFGLAAIHAPYPDAPEPPRLLLVALDAMAVLGLLALWPYQRISGARRALAAVVALVLGLVALETAREPGGRTALVMALPVGLLVAYAARGDWEFVGRALEGALSALDALLPRSSERAGWLVLFEAEHFDLAAEPPNPPNDVPGRSFLDWLVPRLCAADFVVGEPGGEDWGWYLEVERGERRWLVGASARSEGDSPVTDWTVQVLPKRPRRGVPVDAPDPLLEVMLASMESPGFRQVEIEESW